MLVAQDMHYREAAGLEHTGGQKCSLALSPDRVITGPLLPFRAQQLSRVAFDSYTDVEAVVGSKALLRRAHETQAGTGASAAREQGREGECGSPMSRATIALQGPYSLLQQREGCAWIHSQVLRSRLPVVSQVGRPVPHHEKVQELHGENRTRCKLLRRLRQARAGFLGRAGHREAPRARSWI